MIKVFDMFAGYGGAEFALIKAGIEHECIGFSEIDKYAIQCFQQNHKGKNFGDCTKINTAELPDFDLLTGGFPCQDVSIAGKRDLSRGRTNLYKEVLRIAEAKKPKYMLLENVKGLLSINKDRNLRDIIVRDLNKIGYDVCFKCLNSKDFGIPQNRERVWFVCKYGKWEFGEFMFPQPKEKKLTLKDILLDEVDEKYYLTNKQVERLLNHSRSYNERMCKEDNTLTLCARDYKDSKVVQYRIGHTKSEFANNLYESETTRTLETSGNLVILIDPRKYSGDTKPREYIESPILMARARTDETPILKDSFRRLTPKECFRLMGFVNDEINLQGLSDTQCYKLAGNGWEINVVSLIFKEMFKQKEE